MFAPKDQALAATERKSHESCRGTRIIDRFAATPSRPARARQFEAGQMETGMSCCRQVKTRRDRVTCTSLTPLTKFGTTAGLHCPEERASERASSFHLQIQKSPESSCPLLHLPVSHTVQLATSLPHTASSQKPVAISHGTQRPRFSSKLLPSVDAPLLQIQANVLTLFLLPRKQPRRHPPSALASYTRAGTSP